MSTSALAPARPSVGTPQAAARDTDSGLDSQAFAEAGALPPQSHWIGWRLRLLVAAALLGCVALFALARLLAMQPHLDASWRSDRAGRVLLERSDDPALRPFEGRALISVGGGGMPSAAPIDALMLQRSSRWLVGDDYRRQHAVLHEQLAAALAQPMVRLNFADGALVELTPLPRGYASLGTMFWLMCATALLLYLVSVVALLARPRARKRLYALIAGCQTGNLLFVAVESTLRLNLPDGFSYWDAHARTAFDLITGAAVVHACALHPTRLPGARALALLIWGGMGALLALVLAGALANVWWSTQAACIGCGLAAIGLLSWSYRIEPHPFAVLLRRLGMAAVGMLVLLSAIVGGMAGAPVMPSGASGVGSAVWSVFFASLLLLVPFLSHSQQLMREFSLLAAASTVAAALDLLFAAVFSLGPFASLTLSLFLALGVYAGARQWILSQLPGGSMHTTERMFEQLYRIAREVEAHPQSAPMQVSRLLREMFEPLEVRVTGKRSARTRIVAHGSTLLVPVPDLSSQLGDTHRTAARSIVIRYAQRGRRLFTREDARLTDRVVEQLSRAVAFDKAVEQGRSEERARLAQDLHDDIGARLLTLMYKAPTPEMEEYVRHTLQDLKTLTRGLAAPSHRLSHAAAEWKADLMQRLSSAHIELAWSFEFDDDVLLTVVQWSGLTRVLRELVSNAIAHAQASRVAIDFGLQADRLDLVVGDNGRGRAPRAWAHGLGMGGVRKRVKQLGGEVEWVELAPRGIACKVCIRELSRSA